MRNRLNLSNLIEDKYFFIYKQKGVVKYQVIFTLGLVELIKLLIERTNQEYYKQSGDRGKLIWVC